MSQGKKKALMSCQFFCHNTSQEPPPIPPSLTEKWLVVGYVIAGFLFARLARRGGGADVYECTCKPMYLYVDMCVHACVGEENG